MAEVKIEEQQEPAVEEAVEAEPEAKPKAKRTTRKKSTTTKSTAAKSTTAKKTTAKKITTKKAPAKRTTRKSAKTASKTEIDDVAKTDELPTDSAAPSKDATVQDEAVASVEKDTSVAEPKADAVEEPTMTEVASSSEAEEPAPPSTEVEVVAEEPAQADEADNSEETSADVEMKDEASEAVETSEESMEEADTDEEISANMEMPDETASASAESVEDVSAEQTDDAEDSEDTSESTEVEMTDETSEIAEASAEDGSDETSESTDDEEDSSEDDGGLKSEDLADIVAQANTLSETTGRSDSSHARDRRSDTRSNPRYESKHDRVESPLGARTIVELEAMHLDELRDLARAMSVTGYTRLKKYDLVMRLLRANAELQGHIFGGGILETVQDGIGFLRSDHLLPGPEDVYVSQSQIRRFAMRTGDLVIGQVRPPKDTEKYYSLLKVEAVNGIDPEEGKRRTVFEKLTPIFPNDQFYLETKQNIISTRLIDILSPIGRGQRGLIVSPPKAGKTTILKRIANGISANYSDLHLMVVLIGERPEEVTDMDRSVEAEVVSSTFDEPVQSHVRVAEMAMARAKRLVENQQDVVILLDSVTRLSRAYNLTVPASGRTLSGGIDPAALYPPKRFFGAARNIEEGGSLTIIATCLVDTGSRMDDVIYEEFKGTGNMELTLSRRLAERRIFPALDIEKSSTRAEEKLLGTETLAKVYTLRRMIDAMGGGHEALLPIIERMARTRTNEDFLETLTKR